MERPPGSEAALAHPWSRAPVEVARRLGVDSARGLDREEVARRLARWGPNQLRQAPRRSAAAVVVCQLANLIAALLAVAAVLAFAFGGTVDGLAIVAVLAINTAIGAATELRAVRSMEALRRLAVVETRVRRDGASTTVPAQDLVPGDLVVVEGGDLVTADLRLLEASKLEADESTLTGESVPVGKGTEAVSEDAPPAERRSMLHKGTVVTRGTGEAVVVATGMATELGRISALVAAAEPQETPLDRRLEALGRRLVWVTLGVAALVVAGGLSAGRPPLLILETAIALAVAAVPEGLPIVATIAQARGMLRMARRGALIERLSAVETLGSTGVILSDKTGTLTENRMSVVEVVLAEGRVEVGGEGPDSFRRIGRPLDPGAAPGLTAALEVGALCNNAEVAAGGDDSDPERVGDPLEVALVETAARAGLARRELLARRPELREVAFDPSVKMMATYHREPEGCVLVAVKGAPEAVLESATRLLDGGAERPFGDAERERWRERNEAMAARGLRVLAVAHRRARDPDEPPFRDLTLLALIGLLDPPRRDVREALRACRTAGIRVVMVTGDQAATARTVAEAVGLDGEGGELAAVDARRLPAAGALSPEARGRLLAADLVARASPEQKLDLITLHQASGAVVAMTGDGVNDAPALRKADIGIAMGERGTQVAREAAAMVLKDDAFSTIVAAVAEGRVIFGNIRRFAVYLLSANASEILVVGLASFVPGPMPILPLQILFLNLVTDVFPALALGVGEGGTGVMERPPRDAAEGVLTGRHWAVVAAYGAAITAAVLAAFGLALGPLGFERREAVTVSFLTLACAQLVHVFNLRPAASPLLANDVVRNRWVWVALALCAGLLAAALTLPGLARILAVVPPSAAGWAVVAGMSLLPLAAGEIGKAVLRRRRANS